MFLCHVESFLQAALPLAWLPVQGDFSQGWWFWSWHFRREIRDSHGPLNQEGSSCRSSSSCLVHREDDFCAGTTGGALVLWQLAQLLVPRFLFQICLSTYFVLDILWGALLIFDLWKYSLQKLRSRNMKELQRHLLLKSFEHHQE